MKKQWLIRTAMIASVVFIASAFVYALTTNNSDKNNSVSVTQTITKGEKMAMMSPKCSDAKAEKKCNSGTKMESDSTSKCNSGKKDESKCNSGKDANTDVKSDAKKDSKCGQGKCNDSKKETDK